MARKRPSSSTSSGKTKKCTKVDAKKAISKKRNRKKPIKSMDIDFGLNKTTKTNTELKRGKYKKADTATHPDSQKKTNKCNSIPKKVQESTICSIGNKALENTAEPKTKEKKETCKPKTGQSQKNKAKDKSILEKTDKVNNNNVEEKRDQIKTISEGEKDKKTVPRSALKRKANADFLNESKFNYIHCPLHLLYEKDKKTVPRRSALKRKANADLILRLSTSDRLSFSDCEMDEMILESGRGELDFDIHLKENWELSNTPNRDRTIKRYDENELLLLGGIIEDDNFMQSLSDDIYSSPFDCNKIKDVPPTKLDSKNKKLLEDLDLRPLSRESSVRVDQPLHENQLNSRRTE